MSKPWVSVVICTRNPRDLYFKRVLGALELQTLPVSEWELLVVDNGSLPAVADRGFSMPSNGRIIIEAREGLTAARIKGIGEASGGLVVFVDDDNVLAGDFLEQARKIAEEFPKIGVFGGRLLPEFEISPPDWMKPFWRNLALVDFDRDRWTNQRDFSIFPPGAGMCVRRELANSYAVLLESDEVRRGMDRVGTSLSSGGDTDLALQATDAGWGVGQFTRLTLTHLIPRERLTLAYQRRLAEGISRSAGKLSAIRADTRPGFLGHRIRGWVNVIRARGPARAIASAAARGWTSGLREGWASRTWGS